MESVYFALMQIGETSLVKIGKSVNPAKRIYGISEVLPCDLTLIAQSDNLIERQVHEKFKHLRFRREWFYYTEEIEEFIKTQCPITNDEKEIFSAYIEYSVYCILDNLSRHLCCSDKSLIVDSAILFASSDIKEFRKFKDKSMREGALYTIPTKSVIFAIEKKPFNDLQEFVRFSNRSTMVECILCFAYKKNKEWKESGFPQQRLLDFTTAKRSVANET